MMKTNYHTHTMRCKHATGTDREYIEAAIKGGLEILGFSDHTPYSFGDGYPTHLRMGMNEVEEYIDSLSLLKEEYKNDIQIHIGLELEYFPSFFDETYEYLKAYPLEYFILAGHYYGNGHIAAGETTFFYPTDKKEYLEEYYKQLYAGMEKDCFTYLAHPDFLNYTGDAKISKDHMRELCRKANAKNLPLEINLHGISTNRHYPNDVFWKIAGEENCQVILGYDAHKPDELLNDQAYDNAMKIVSKYNLNLLESVPLKNPYLV